MESLIAIRRSNVPKYLHCSELYLSLDDSDDDDISVPCNCMKMNAHVNSLVKLENLLFTQRFWIRGTFTSRAINFMVSQLDSKLIELIALFDAYFPRVLQLLKSLIDAKRSDFCDLAAKFGRVDFLDCFNKSRKWKLSVQLSMQTLQFAATHGHLDCLMYCYDQLCQQDNAFVLDKCDLRGVVFADHLDCLTFLVEKGAVPSRKIVRLAALSGHLACLKFLLSKCANSIKSEDLIDAALHGNHVHCLQYLIQQGWEVNMFNWETAINPKHDYDYFNYYQIYGDYFYVPEHSGANAGDIRCLEVLLDSFTSPMADEESCLVAFAFKHGNVTVLKLLHERGLLVHPELVIMAARSGSYECLMYVHEELQLECWVPSTMAAAAGAGQLQLLKQLHKKGCPWDESVTIAAKANRREKCLLYLLQKYGVPNSALFWATPSDLHCRLLVLEFSMLPKCDRLLDV